MGDKKQLIGLEISTAAYKILGFLKVHGDRFIGFEELEERFGPATASALWELRELGLAQLLWEGLDGYPPYNIAGATIAELGRSVVLPAAAREEGRRDE